MIAPKAAYWRNPVVLRGHDLLSVPIGRTETLRVENGTMYVEVRLTDYGEKWVKQCEETEHEPCCFPGYVLKMWTEEAISEADLMEISVVPVPKGEVPDDVEPLRLKEE